MYFKSAPAIASAFRRTGGFGFGFGTNSSNYWRGLDTIHAETANPTELRTVIEMFDIRVNVVTLNYGTFSVGNAASNYRLSTSDYVSNPRYSESFLRQDGSMFSTQDRDNDRDTGHNVATYHFSGGWWYNDAGDTMRSNALYAGNVAVTGTYLFLGLIDGAHWAVKSLEMSYTYAS